jgi:hypothetical protein
MLIPVFTKAWSGDASIAAFCDTITMGRYDYRYDHAAEPMEPDPGQTIEHAIGDVIIAFEELDDAIAGAISGILNRGDEMGRIVTSQLSFRNKVDMFGALVKHESAQLNPRETD